MKALQKEGGGGDHLSVGVRYPDKSYDRPMTKNIFLSAGENKFPEITGTVSKLGDAVAIG